MKKHDILKIGLTLYKVLDIKQGFVLFSWTESTGIQKQRWIRACKSQLKMVG